MSEDMLAVEEEAQFLESIVRKQLEIQRLEEEVATLKSFFKQRPEAYPTGTKQVGKFYIKVTTNRRVDDTLAKQTLGVTEYKRLTKQVIDGTLAKKILPPNRYDQIVKTYDNRIEIGLR